MGNIFNYAGRGTVIATLLAAFFLDGCTPRQERIATQFVTDVCHDVPSAQAWLDQAALTHDVQRAQQLVNALKAFCPAILAKLNTDHAVQSGLLPLDTK